MFVLRVLIVGMSAMPFATTAAPAATCAHPPCGGAEDAGALQWHGEMRLRGLRYAAGPFGARTDDTYALARLLGTLHWQGEHASALVQAGLHGEHGRDGGPGRTDQSALDLQQAWLGWQAGDWHAWAGRQELAYGSARLLSRRDGPNIRLAFDGVRVSRSASAFTLDAFLLRPVENRAGAFDDRADPGQPLWGVYGTRAPGPTGTGLDVYLLGYRRDHARFAVGTGDESRRSVGTRVFGQRGPWDWNVEAVYQWGELRTGPGTSLDVRAWTLASDTGYTLRTLAWAPRVSLKVDLASGDADAADDRLQTFNALYPRASYFSESSLIAPANLLDVQPALTFHPHERAEITVGWDAVWKHRRADAVYTTPAPLTVVPGTAGTSRRIGDQFKLEARYALRPDWELLVHLAHFRVGPALREGGSDDTTYAALTLGWKR